MMANLISDFTKLCVHTLTTKPWNLRECAENFSRVGISAVTVWRNLLENADLREAQLILEDNGMTVVSVARGGFFASVDANERERALDDNRLAIDQAAAIGSPLLVLVCGSDRRQSLEHSRNQIKESIVKLIPYARSAGVKLAVEPLHPMYAGDRSAVNSLAQANQMVEAINSDSVGIVVDVYHLWWDPNLEKEIMRCGENGNLSAFHVCDWNVPTVDFLNDRGLMGDGCINIPQIRGWVEQTGFDGFIEVEVFSDKYWAMDQHEYLEKIKDSYLKFT